MISAQRRHGRFYTPSSVADLAVSVTLGDVWPPARVFDPSCGDGALLAAAARRGLPRAKLHGRDNDPSAVARARSELGGAPIELADLFDQSDDKFAAIIGNPPYVRSDRLDPSTKERISQCLAKLSPAGGWQSLVRRGDLAACALLRSVHMLAPGGRLGFVVSAALLEADYAAPLWSALAELGSVREIVVAPEERWFSEAAVNTLIVVFERGGSGPTRIWRLRGSTEACAAQVAEAADLDAVADSHIDRSGSPRRWAELLRASPLWLEVERSSALVPLGQIADIRRGVTSGANDVFYMTRAEAAERGIEPALLAPLVRAPPKFGDVSIDIEPAALETVALRAPESLEAFSGAAAYLETQSDAASRPTLAVRTPWWRLPSRPARLFFTKAYAQRFVQRTSATPLDCDQRVYAVWPKSGVDVELLAAVLNGSLSALAIESLGRASMGEGALEWTVADARTLPILDPRRLDRDAVMAAFAALRSRPIGIAANEAERADRRALDRALAKGTELPAAGFAAAVADASSARAERARC